MVRIHEKGPLPQPEFLSFTLFCGGNSLRGTGKGRVAVGPTQAFIPHGTFPPTGRGKRGSHLFALQLYIATRYTLKIQPLAALRREVLR
jgi:hypothetical protein